MQPTYSCCIVVSRYYDKQTTVVWRRGALGGEDGISSASCSREDAGATHHANLLQGTRKLAVSLISFDLELEI
jgi:hypothetical protein